MKKLIALALAVVTVMSSSMVAFAENTTTLTTTVPEATYTLNIPANQEIPFGNLETDIGSITVTDSKGFAEGKNLKLTLSHTDFICENVSTIIPYKVHVQATLDSDISINLSEESAYFYGLKNGTVKEFIYRESGYYADEYDITLITIDSEDWAKALAGDYTSVMTFTTEVVVEE